MSSSPAAGEDLRITVKRDRDGAVSNWLNDTAAPGDIIQALPPQGRFVLKDTERDLIAFAGGSGITPVFSLLRSALISSTRSARLFYANRARDSVIFGEPLSSMNDVHAQRFSVHHHLDDESGFVTPAHVEAFVADAKGAGDPEYYICGPGPFMDVVQTTLQTAGVPAHRIHLEHFEVAQVPASPAAAAGEAVTEEVTIELDGRKTKVAYSAGETLLQTARMAGLRAPSSCEVGSCGTCMARLTEGNARMLNNDALEDDEVDDGWVLTCQALPTSRTVRVVYE
jgi:ferredoxin-NADP reductase